MNPRITILAAAAAALSIAMTLQADARPRHIRASQTIDVAAIPAYPIERQHRGRRGQGPVTVRSVDTSSSQQWAPDVSQATGWASNGETAHRGRRGQDTAISFIPNPSGCNRTFLSCACRLAAYWNLGPGLDAVATWPGVFARTHAPGPRVAAVRNSGSHILGVVGGHDGAWDVVDFNSGEHKNRSYTLASLSGYTLYDTSVRIGSVDHAQRRSARRHAKHHHHNRVRYARNH